MAQPYVGEIRMFAGNFAPAGWMFCEGQLLPISENETLFQSDRHHLRRRRTEHVRACPTCAAACRSTWATASSWPKTGGAGGGHADRAADSRAHPPAAGVRRPTATRRTAANDVLARVRRRPDLYVAASQPLTAHERRQSSDRSAAASRTTTFSRTCASTSSFRCSGSSRRQTLRSGHSHGRSVCRRNPDLPVQLRARGAGRCATGSCCRSRRTRRCSRCSARPTAATASRTSRCRTCRAVRRCTRARARACRCTTWARPAGRETVTLLESEIPAHTHTLQRLRRSDQADITRQSERHLGTAARASTCTATRRPTTTLSVQAAGARRRRPAAQQPAAVPDVQLLHRAAGRVPAARVDL